MAGGKLIGKFMTYYDHRHEFAQREMDLALTIGRQLGFAIERLRSEAALRAEREVEDEGMEGG